MYATEIESPIGRLTLASDGTALTGLWIENQKYFASTLDSNPEIRSELPVFHETEVWLNAYFDGSPLPPLPKLAPQGSVFRQNVWNLLLDLSIGETTTYGAMTKILRERGISAASQAVGGAVGHNPILILIPCHRVLGSNGSLTGYAGGLDVKRYLLDLEGISYK